MKTDPKLYYDYGYGDNGFGCYLWYSGKLIGFIPDLSERLSMYGKKINRTK